MYLEIYEVDPKRFISVPRLIWQVALKTIKAELELLVYIDMLLMVQKGIIEGICHSINSYAKDNNKCMKDYNKNKASCIKHWDEIIDFWMDLSGSKIFLNLMKVL